MNKFTLIIIFNTIFGLSCYAQYKSKTVNNDSLKTEWAQKELQKAVLDTGYMHRDKLNVIISTEKEAIEFAEMVLFKDYWKREIRSGKPYNVCYIYPFWIIWGSKINKETGDSFLIIFDARDCRILKLTHP